MNDGNEPRASKKTAGTPTAEDPRQKVRRLEDEAASAVYKACMEHSSADDDDSVKETGPAPSDHSGSSSNRSSPPEGSSPENDLASEDSQEQEELDRCWLSFSCDNCNAEEIINRSSPSRDQGRDEDYHNLLSFEEVIASLNREELSTRAPAESGNRDDDHPTGERHIGSDDDVSMQQADGPKSPEEQLDENLGASPEDFSEAAIVVAGGFNSNDVEDPESGKMMYAYDPASNEWTDIAELPEPRHHHCMVYLNGFLYIIGGCDPRTTRMGELVALRMCHALDLSSMQWRAMPDLRHCRMYHSVVALGAKVYVIGGRNEERRLLDSVEVYDPQSGTWSQMDHVLPFPTMGAGVCVYGGRVALVGGKIQVAQGTFIVKDAWAFDPARPGMTWEARGLPSGRIFTSTSDGGDCLYAVGGVTWVAADEKKYEDQLASLDEVLRLDEGSGRWMLCPRLPSPRHFFGMACVGRSLFVLGGQTKSLDRPFAVLDDVLLLDSGADSWRSCGKMPVSLFGFAVARTPKEV